MKFLRVLGLMLALLLGVSISVPSIAKGPKPKKPKKNSPAAVNFCTDSIDGAIEFELSWIRNRPMGDTPFQRHLRKGL